MRTKDTIKEEDESEYIDVKEDIYKQPIIVQGLYANVIDNYFKSYEENYILLKINKNIFLNI